MKVGSRRVRRDYMYYPKCKVQPGERFLFRVRQQLLSEPLPVAPQPTTESTCHVANNVSGTFPRHQRYRDVAAGTLGAVERGGQIILNMGQFAAKTLLI